MHIAIARHAERREEQGLAILKRGRERQHREIPNDPRNWLMSVFAGRSV